MTRRDPKIATFGGLTLDRVVKAGKVFEDVPGGNALYAALGAWLYGASASVVSFAGRDYPDATLIRLEQAGLDISLVERVDAPSIRLWVLYEDDGQRQILYRTGSSDLAALENTIAPAVGRQSSGAGWDGAHVGALPVRLQRPIIDELGELGLHLTLDSIEARGNVGGDLPDYLRGEMLSRVTTFLPSSSEMTEICGRRSFAETVVAMKSLGLTQLVVKRGDAGADVYDLVSGAAVKVSTATPSGVVDPTGAGDVFCGAFLAASLRGMSPAEAAVAGAAAASCVIEDVGAMHLLDVSQTILRDRERTVRTEPLRTEFM